MPLYEFSCPVCSKKIEKVQGIDTPAPLCCDLPMEKSCGSLAYFTIEGLGYPSRKKWMDNWTPGSREFPVAREHGEWK